MRGQNVDDVLWSPAPRVGTATEAEGAPAARRWARFVAVPLPRRWRYLAYAASCLVFLAILFVRGGPNPAETDAHAVTFPTTAISHADLRLAERETLVPNPPGYPLLMAPLVTVLRPWVGSPRWCDDKAIPAVLRGPGAAYFRGILSPCSPALAIPHAPRYPVWWRSQAVLVVTAWMVLAAGAVLLLRAAGAGGGVGELVLLAGLLVLPGTTDAVAQSFHPQDIMCVGFTCAALAQALRRRPVAAGLLFGAAFLCKQFALLPLIGVLAVTPGWRARARTAAPAVLLPVAAVLPFYALDPTGTVHALSAVYVSGAGIQKTPTVVGILGVGEQLKLELARDVPVAAALLLALVVWRRAGAKVGADAVALVGLALACLALRLVFEVTILDYYFLAVGAFLVVLDCCRRRPPLAAVVWVVAARYGLTALASRAPLGVGAAAYLALSLAALALGLGVALRAGAGAPQLAQSGTGASGSRTSA